MVHIVFHGLMILYNFLYFLVIKHWIGLLFDFYCIGKSSGWNMKNRMSIGFLFEWIVSIVIFFICIGMFFPITEVSAKAFVLDMTFITGLIIIYDRCKEKCKKFPLKSRIRVITLFVYTSLFAMVFSYLKNVFY